jgi:hypothetical protein
MNSRFQALMAATLITLGAGQALAQTQAAQLDQKVVPALLADLAKYQGDEKRVATNIAIFDSLDFDVFTNQKWDRLHESHAQDIVVHWPDGHQTKGIDVHIADLKAMFVYAPDTRIQTPPGQVRSRGVDGRDRRNGRHLHEADARGRWQDDCANRQELQAHHGNRRPLERRHDG